MKPLEEYMFFTKSGADNITVINPQGVRSAQCVAKFDITEQPSQEPMVNVSLVSTFIVFIIKFSELYMTKMSVFLESVYMRK